MATETLEMVLGSDPVFDLQLYPKRNDQGTNGISLLQISEQSCVARLKDGSGSSILLSLVIVNSQTGVVRLTPSKTSFPVVGVYTLQLVFIDQSGRTFRFPTDGKSLEIRVNQAT